MANTKIDTFKFFDDKIYEIDLPTAATPIISGLSVMGTSNLTDVNISSDV